MNERIQELAEQATTIEYGADNGFDRVTFNKEKFAELIVKKCTAHIELQSQELRKLCRNEVSWANKELYEERIETCDDLIWQIGKIFESK